MAEKSRLATDDQLTMRLHGELEQPVELAEKRESRSLRAGMAAGCLALSLVAPSSHEETELPEWVEAVQSMEQTLNEVFEERRQLELELERRQSDPHYIEDDVIVLRDEPGIQQYADTFIEAAEEFSVNPNYLATIAWLESTGGLNTGPSPAGAEGYMQVMPATAQEVLELTHLDSYDAYDTKSSIRMGAAALSIIKTQLEVHIDDFEQSTIPYDVLLASYNAGSGRGKEYVEADYDRSVLPAETRDYLRKAEEILD